LSLFNNVTIGYDLTFELNEFNEPRIKSEIELIRDVVLFICFTKPGQYPSLPYVGLDLESMLYSFYDEISDDDIKDKLISQCAALGYPIKDGTIQVRKTKYKGEPSLLIHIEGTESYPNGYKRDTQSDTTAYLIGITFDELKKLIYNINTVRRSAT